MSFEANGSQALATGVRCQTEPAKNSRLNCVVAQKVLAIELTPLSKPRLVMISANSLVELTGTSCAAGFVELVWNRKTYLIFAADLVRLKAGQIARDEAPHPAN